MRRAVDATTIAEHTGAWCDVPEHALTLVIGVTLALGVGLPLLAAWLQLRFQPERPPPEVADVLGQSRFDRAKSYASARLTVAFWRGVATVVSVIVALASGLIGRVHGAVTDGLITGWPGSLLTVGVVLLAYDMLQLPFDLWATFGVETRFGFNRISLATFMRDRALGRSLAAVAFGAMMAGFLAFHERVGPSVWIPFAGAVAVVHVSLAMVESVTLRRLYNSLELLPPGDLHDDVAKYLRHVGFEGASVFVMDASKRSAKANAEFAGIGPVGRVILYDTLLANHDPDEIVAAVAHELGHRKHRHLPAWIATEVVTLIALLYLTAHAVGSEAFGIALGVASGASGLGLLVLIAAWFGPMRSVALMPLLAVMRQSEFEADAHAAATYRPDALVRVLARLEADSLVLPTAHPLYACVHLDHPATVERIRALRRFESP